MDVYIRRRSFDVSQNFFWLKTAILSNIKMNADT
jgi:hypothetical protein